MLAQVTNPDVLWPLIEKGGLIAGLAGAVVFLVRWVQASQGALIGILKDTVDRNTAALHDVRSALSQRRGDTAHTRKTPHEHTD